MATYAAKAPTPMPKIQTISLPIYVLVCLSSKRSASKLKSSKCLLDETGLWIGSRQQDLPQLAALLLQPPTIKHSDTVNFALQVLTTSILVQNDLS